MAVRSIFMAINRWICWRDAAWRSGAERDWALLIYAGVLFTLAGALFALLDYHWGFSALHALAREYLPSEIWANVTFFGDAKVALAVSTFLVFRYPRLALAVLIAALASTLVVHLLKAGLAQPRPPAVIAPDFLDVIGPAYKGKSFPSGHTATAFVMAGLLTRVVGYWLGRWMLLGAAVMIGVSRVAVGVHWPIDVLFGAGVGLCAAWVGLYLSDRLKFGAISFLSITLVLLIAPFLLFLGHGGFDATRVTAPVIGGVSLLVSGWCIRCAYQEIFAAHNECKSLAPYGSGEEPLLS